MSRLPLAALALLLALAGAPTHAQDVGATPTYGDADLTEGFRPDPYTKTLTAGGPIAVNKGACTYGYVAEAPDVDLYYTTSGGSTLYLYAESERDVTLLVNTPDASWVCDDDALGGSNPILVIPDAPDGLYDIWIGTYGDETAPATLYISEVDPRDAADGPPSAPGASIDVGAAPTYGDVRLSEGFQPDPHTTTLTAGGPIPVDQGACAYGYVASAPDVDLYYTTSGNGTLYLHVAALHDTTLLVNLPDGSWVCDDDSKGERQPLLVIPNAPDGLYDIWIGTYEAEPQEARLYISEVDPR